MLKRIKNWANQNEGFIALVGILIGLALAIGPGLATAFSSIMPSVSGFIKQFSGILVGLGIIVLVGAFAWVSMNQRKQVSEVEKRTSEIEKNCKFSRVSPTSC